ncbi:SID1 transmembrane family member 2, partial [Orchesella cincta]
SSMESFTRKSWIRPTVFFLLAAVTGGFAVKFYIDNAAQWEETAAGSRAMNQECLSWMGSFYDTHDVWHFLSAISLYFMFMGLLVLEDDMVATPRCKIVVF